MALPPQWRWLVSDEGAHLHYHYACKASVTRNRGQPGCTVRICWGARELLGRAATVAQGMRHLERWWAARRWSPKSKPRQDSRELLPKWQVAERDFWAGMRGAVPRAEPQRVAVRFATPEAWILGSDALGRCGPAFGAC